MAHVISTTIGGGSMNSSEPQTMYSMRTVCPDPTNKFYLQKEYGGWSPCIAGSPCAWPGSVLANCVGYACGRFNEIIGTFKYPISTNAKEFVKYASSHYPELRFVDYPVVGGIMVWDGTYGHVAIVEQILEQDGNGIPTRVLCSESDYGSTIFITRERSYSGGTWGSASGYKLIKCIANPSINYGNIVYTSSNYGASGGAHTFGGYTSDVVPKIRLSGNQTIIKYNAKAEAGIYVPGNGKTVTYSHEDPDADGIQEKLRTVNSSNLNRTRSTGLLTYPSLVESPFIIVKIGDFTFGSVDKSGDASRRNSTLKITYPNFMQYVNIVKVNGQVNQYTIGMVYQIQPGQDPNMLDKIFSSVGYGKIKISYGDWSSPTFIYKEEEALITNVASNIDFSSSRINYTISCTSNSIKLVGGSYNFPARNARPSDVIREILYNNTYGLLDIFYGMKNKTVVNSLGLLNNDDKVVKIESKENLDPLSYINYLVTCMSSVTNTGDSVLKDSSYYLTIHDDVFGENNLNGPYFKITKVRSSTKTLATHDTYEVDIGYPDDTYVTRFTLRNDNSWSLLYNYSGEIDQQNYVYRIDDEGKVVTTYSPSLTTSSVHNVTTEQQKTWWTQMTQFPISAELEIKGLVRPSLLMTYLRVNAFFFGQRHISSGLYIITRQQDRVDSNGYRTVLSLTRVGGDTDYIQKVTAGVNHPVMG